LSNKKERSDSANLGTWFDQAQPILVAFGFKVIGAGLTIGAAWSGMLGNFAACIFLLILRPYKASEYVMVGGVEGTVVEIGLFGTSIDTPDNVRTIVCNGKVMGDDINNFTANPFRKFEIGGATGGHG
jgi:small conductance mechanosensitive channel